MGPSSAQADSDPKTSLSRLTGADLELVKGADSDQITLTSLLMPIVTTSESDPIKAGEQVPVPQVLRCYT